MSEWIRVSDRMPYPDEYVIWYGLDAIAGCNRMTVARRRIESYGVFWDVSCVSGYEWDFDIDEPTHWMPLPQEPKE